MTRGTAVGAPFTVAGLAGYTAGVVVDYLDRAFSLTAFMVGVVLVAVAPRPAEVTAR